MSGLLVAPSALLRGTQPVARGVGIELSRLRAEGDGARGNGHSDQHEGASRGPKKKTGAAVAGW